MSLLAIIPARGGSKGIPDKNLKKINGKSLVSLAIEAARSSKKVTDILVTTDSDDIKEESESCGISVPFTRPESLATDQAEMIDVVLHAIEQYSQHYKRDVDFVVVLQPTSPFRTGKDIDKCFSQLSESQSSSIVSVHRLREHPYECISKSDKRFEKLRNYNGANFRQNYQEEFFYINGAIYMCHREYLEQSHGFFSLENSMLYEMNPLCGIDIDEPDDLLLARSLASNPEFSRKVSI